MLKSFLYSFLIFWFCPLARGQNWNLKIGNVSTFENILDRGVVEWNDHYLIAYYQNFNSYNIAIVNKNAQIIKTINIKSRDYPDFYIYGLSVLNGKLLVSGSLGTNFLLEEGCFFELDSCFKPINFTKIEHKNTRDSFSRVFGFANYDLSRKTLIYYVSRNKWGGGTALVNLENDTIKNVHYIEEELETFQIVNNELLFAGSNGAHPPNTNVNDVYLKGFFGSCNTDITRFKFNYYRYIDSNNFSMSTSIGKLENENKSVILIYDRSKDISKNPNVLGAGTVAIVDNSNNQIDKESRFFTDTSYTEFPSCQLVSSNGKIYMFTGQNNDPEFHTIYGYIYDLNLNKLLKKQIGVNLGYLHGFWDSDSSIVLYSYFNDNGNYSVVLMKYDKDLNEVTNSNSYPNVPLCSNIPNSIELKDYKVLILDHDTSKYIRRPTNVISHNKFNFSIYPNPSNGKFNVSISHGKDYLIDVYDLYGRLLVQNLKVNDSNPQIDLQFYKASMYTLVIKTTNGEAVSVQKIIKE
ncbi:MAG: T9SS type A sorting domain-containing protein [bacterium]|nr:T9SS type A sorting domain-containing protein [bacterium]